MKKMSFIYVLIGAVLLSGGCGVQLTPRGEAETTASVTVEEQATSKKASSKEAAESETTEEKEDNAQETAGEREDNASKASEDTDHVNESTTAPSDVSTTKVRETETPTTLEAWGANASEATAAAQKPPSNADAAETSPAFSTDDVWPLIYACGSVIGWGYADGFDAERAGYGDRLFADALLYEFLHHQDFGSGDSRIKISEDAETYMRVISAADMFYVLRRLVGDFPGLIRPPAELFIFLNDAGDYTFGYSDKGETDFDPIIESVEYAGGNVYEATALLYKVSFGGDDGYGGLAAPREPLLRFSMRFKKDDDSAYGYTIVKCEVVSRISGADDVTAAVNQAGGAQSGTPVPSAGDQSYDGVIRLYRELINFERDYDEIEEFVENMSRIAVIAEEKQKYELSNSVYETLGSSDYSYAFKDINGDGAPELFMLFDDAYSSGNISAIYTLRGGKPALVGGYWSRCSCVVDKNGFIFVYGSSGADNSYTASYWLIPGSAELQLVKMVGVEDYDEETGEFFSTPRYYKIENGIKKIIPEDEADMEFSAMYIYASGNPAQHAGLDAVPMLKIYD